MSSSNKQGSKILAVLTPRDAQRLLLDWVNLDFLRGRDDQLRRFRARHKDVIGPLRDGDLQDLRDELRLVWDEQDRRRQDWYIFRLRDSFHRYGIMHDITEKREAPSPQRLAGRLSEPPEITAFEAAMFYFQRQLAASAKHCRNETCPAPYFIAKKKWQKFCSEKCTGPANRESKREWWRKNRAKSRGLQ
jgi:hypothetical protein